MIFVLLVAASAGSSGRGAAASAAAAAAAATGGNPASARVRQVALEQAPQQRVHRMALRSRAKVCASFCEVSQVHMGGGAAASR